VQALAAPTRLRRPARHGLVPDDPPHRSPLAELVAAQRRRQSLSLAEVARRLRRAAVAEGSHCGATRQWASELERKGRIPRPDMLRWLAVALGLPVEEVAAAAEQQRANRQHARWLAVAERLLSTKPGQLHPATPTPALVTPGSTMWSTTPTRTYRLGCPLGAAGGRPGG